MPPAPTQDYIESIEDPDRRADVARLDELIRATLPDLEPVIAHGMLGYGPFRYRYASGREGETVVLALASQKRHLSLYVNCATPQGYLAESYKERLPAADIGRSCVRFKRLADLDDAVLLDLLAEAGRTRPAGAVD